MDVKFLADTRMADSKRELELQKASFNQEVNTKVGTLRFEPMLKLGFKQNVCYLSSALLRFRSVTVYVLMFSES